jgi:hypothetical protein
MESGQATALGMTHFRNRRDPMTTPTTAPGHMRVKVLRRLEYARDLLPVGAIVVVDSDTAARWIKAKIAVETDAAMAMWTSCPRCGSAFPIAETPEAGQRWIECRNARCGYGWYR